MEVVGLDGMGDLVEVQRTVGLVPQRLGLGASQYSRPAAFIFVGVSVLSDNVLIAPLAVRQYANKVALRTAGCEDGRFFTQHLSRQRFQAVDGRVFAVDVVANFRFAHRISHRRGGFGYGVAS